MSVSQEPSANSSRIPPEEEAERGFAARYRRSYPKLTAVAAGVLGRQEGAEDVVQHAAGIAIAKGNQFATDAGFMAWMVSAVRKCALNHRRKLRRRRTYAIDPVDLAAVDSRPAEPSASPVDPRSGELVADQDCFEDRLLDALEGLSDDARCCLLLRTVHELSYAEISELLGIPAGTAMSHVHRSRQLLRKRLK